MKPALSAEEWLHDDAWDTESFVCAFVSEGVLEVANTDGRPTGKTDNLHGVAALCLHGQEFGFTREDVDYLRGNANKEGFWEPERRATLADRIEALLPPEEGSITEEEGT